MNFIYCHWPRWNKRWSAAAKWLYFLGYAGKTRVQLELGVGFEGAAAKIMRRVSLKKHRKAHKKLNLARPNFFLLLLEFAKHTVNKVVMSHSLTHFTRGINFNKQ